LSLIGAERGVSEKGRKGVLLQSDFARWLARHVLPHEPALRRWLGRQLPPDLAIDDVVQEAYARLASLRDHDAIAHPRAYFFQAARSVVLMHLRRSRIVRIEAMAEIRNPVADDARTVAHQYPAIS